MQTFKTYITEGISDFIIHSASSEDFFKYMGNDTYVANHTSSATDRDGKPIVDILGPDAIKKWPYYMSFARTKTGTYRIVEGKNITLVLDADKIRNIRGAKMFGAFDWYETNKTENTRRRGARFEFEDRILLKDKHLTNFTKYIKEIHVKHWTFSRREYAQHKINFMDYIKKNGIPTWQHTKGSWKSINKNKAEKIN